MRMSGKVVIVTGAAQNNGLGIAERFAAHPPPAAARLALGLGVLARP